MRQNLSQEVKTDAINKADEVATDMKEKRNRSKQKMTQKPIKNNFPLSSLQECGL